MAHYRDVDFGLWRYAPDWLCDLIIRHQRLFLYELLVRNPRLLWWYWRSPAARHHLRQIPGNAKRFADSLSVEEQIAYINRHTARRWRR
jgi:hypothetical protein